MQHELLLIDADKDLTDIVVQTLTPEGFNIVCVHDGESAVIRAINHCFHAIIIDIMLPNLNGFEVLKAIREHSDAPILILTARNDDVDRIVGLEIGADDYLAKPCNPGELLARLRTLLRRTNKNTMHKSIMNYNNILVDPSKRIVTYNNKPMDLTNAEFNILEMLIKTPGKALSKEELTEYALGRKYTSYDRSIDVHVSNLRNKLNDHQHDEPLIKTIRGFGYMLNG